MEKRQTIVIGLTGNLLSDQRMQRIGSALSENGYRILVYYRHYYKYKPITNTIQTAYPFETRPVSTIFTSGVFFYLWFNGLLFIKILFTKADYYYAVDSDALPAFILLSIIKRKPLTYDAHEYFSEVPELKNSKIKKYIWHMVTKLGTMRAHSCLTVGKELAAKLSEVYKRPFITVMNVPLYEPSEVSQSYAKPVILYQGALNAGRELELLIDAMSQLQEFQCILAGEGDLSASLRERASPHSNIEFKGLMRPAELKLLTPACFAGFNLLVPDSLSYYYSLSNKYFDYMHAGIPSISSRLPEYETLNNKLACGVCIDNTLDALVNVIRVWQQDKVVYDKLKENAILASKTYNWQNEKLLLKPLFNH